jgi:hypothetical protein
MKLMSDYVTKLEGFPDLEVSIIRATKINKVLKGILKLNKIPKEDEFKFKPRSQVLLDKWNKLLSADGTPAAGEVNGTAKPAKANGVKEKSEAAEPVKTKEEAKEDAKEDANEDATEPAKSEEPSEAAEKPAAGEVRLRP